VALPGRLVEVLEPLARRRRVRLEIEIGAVRQTLQLAPAPGEGELDVGCAGRVVGELLLVVLAETKAILGDPEGLVPRHALRAPVLEPSVRLRRRHEVL